MTRRQRMIICLSAFALTLSIPLALAMLLFLQPRWFACLGMLFLVNVLLSEVWLVKRLRHVQQPVVWIVALWVSGTAIMPIAVLILRTIFDIVGDAGIAISMGISAACLCIPAIYIVQVVRKL